VASMPIVKKTTPVSSATKSKLAAFSAPETVSWIIYVTEMI
jgi:hypothetical protein